jgi:hypothetical protein
VTRRPRIDYEKAVIAMTVQISGKASYPATWENCEAIARRVLKPLLSQPRKANLS